MFPHGRTGWTFTMTRNEVSQCNLTLQEYVNFILQVRHNNYLLLYGRLFHQYVCDAYSRILAQRLRWVRFNQTTVRAELYSGVIDAIDNVGNNPNDIGRLFILPVSIFGTPRYYHGLLMDAMARVTKYGKPHYFITMTCNPQWPEIVSNLPPTQTASDRPDLVVRVFNAKFHQFLDDVTKKHVLGKPVAWSWVIEFQKRGLPHAHCLFIMDPASQPTTPEMVDATIKAVIPHPVTQPRLYNIVTRTMMHGPCGPIRPSCPCMRDGNCSKKFPKPFNDASTSFGQDNYANYHRPQNGRVTIVKGIPLDNRWVVPYCPWLSLRYDCHLNVEYCASVKSVKYLYKYTFKGGDRAAFGVQTNNRDEISRYQEGYWFGTSEALWRIFGLRSHGGYPSVTTLQIHLENQQLVILQPDVPLNQNTLNGTTQLTQFFQTMCDPNVRRCRYTEMPTYFTWNVAAKQWRQRKKGVKNVKKSYPPETLG